VHDRRDASRESENKNYTTNKTKHSSLLGLLPRGAMAVAVARANLIGLLRLA
jgi:hypothetical protein